MKDFASLYFWYEKLVFKVFRIFVLVLLTVLSILGLYGQAPDFALILLSLYLIFEVFFIYKVSRLIPSTEVLQNSSDPLNSFTLETLGIFNSRSNTSGLIKELLSLPQVNFIIAKADAYNKDLQLLDIDKNILSQNALLLSKEVKGKYVTTMDLFVSYLLLTEPNTKFLFAKKLKPGDIKNILTWARKTYTKEEDPKGADLTFAGEGIAESWVYGWTIETAKYMADLSGEFLSGKDLKPTGRKNEYFQIVEALSKGGNAILVGDAGSGKESAVKELAIESYSGHLTGNLFHQRIYELMIDAFMAGAQTQGELEGRLNALVEEVSHSGNAIIYIPEFQNILGSSSFKLDISGSLTPYLNHHSIRIIAAVTPGAFKRFVEPLHSFLDFFTVINFDEPPKEQVLEMLFTKAAEIEERDKATLTYKAIIAAAEYANRYVKEKALPGSAVTLLDDTSNVVRLSGRKLVEEQDIFDQVQKKTKVSVGEPKQEEKQLLLNLETELHKRVIDQEEAIKSISESIRRLRTGLKIKEKPISFLFLGPTGVGKTETAKALADVYFGNGTRLVRLDMSEFSGDAGMKRLLGSGPGEGDEKGQLTEPVYDSPYSLVLLDEFEKADQKILDLFLQVLDDGRLTDNKGKTVSFVNTIIIATSNAASEFVRESVAKGVSVDKKFQDSLLNFLQEKALFKPELLNRFDDIVVFEPLGQNEVVQIVGLMLKDVIKRLEENDIKVSFDERVIQKIAVEGYDKDFGARPLSRFIQDNIEDLVAQKMLRDEIKRGDTIRVLLDSQNNLLVTKS